MDISVTTNTAKLARQYKLEPKELAFADLVACGWPPEDAWNAAIREGISWTKTARKQAIKELAASQGVQERIAAVKAVLRKDMIEKVRTEAEGKRQDLVSEAMSKEQMLYDLQLALKGKDPGSSEWLKIKQLIVDVTRMKQEEIKDDEKTIHHYLPVDYPVSCEFCLRSRCDECRYKKACEDGE